MAENTFSAYLAWITPTAGDPTHSLLRAHLLFEQMLDAFLEKRLSHPSALSDARFTFAQKMAITKAIAQTPVPSDWTWQALARLNKIRNALAHSPGPKLDTDLRAYVDYCVKHSKNPLPVVVPKKNANGVQSKTAVPMYSAADMVTIGLYIHLSSRLGFDVNAFLELGEGAA